MTLLAGVLGLLLLIALIYIFVNWIIARLTEFGGFTIRIESVDDGE